MRTSTYAERKQKVLRRLAALQARLDAAEPGGLPWEVRNEILETVERLPGNEQKHWRANYLDQLNTATESLEQYWARQIPTQQGVSR